MILVTLKNFISDSYVKSIKSINFADDNEYADILLARYYNHFSDMSEENKIIAKMYFMRCYHNNNLKYIYSGWKVVDFEVEFYRAASLDFYAKEFMEKYLKDINNEQLEFIINESEYNEFANKFLARYYFGKDNDKSFEYEVKAGLSYLFERHGKDGYVVEYTDQRYVDFLQKEENKGNFEIEKRLFKLYCDFELRKKFNLKLDSEYMDSIYRKIQEEEAENKRAQQALLMMDPEYQRKQREREIYLKKLEEKCLNLGYERMKKYPCKALNDWLLTGDTKPKNIVKKYGAVTVVDNIDLTIYENEFVTLLGPSGCGKSSLLSILANLEKSTDGNIKFNRDNIKIGYMLQSDSLFPWRTILENCLLDLEINNTLNEFVLINILLLIIPP